MKGLVKEKSLDPAEELHAIEAQIAFRAAMLPRQDL